MAKDQAPTERRAVEPNIFHVNVHLVWGMGVDGTGMAAAGIDTGARFAHEFREPRCPGNLSHDHNWHQGVVDSWHEAGSSLSSPESSRATAASPNLREATPRVTPIPLSQAGRDLGEVGR